MAKIAIIGSGISSLSAAYLLHADHEITVYEQGHEIGGHARTRNIIIEDKTIPVDTGFIVYNERNYPNFVALLRHLGVNVQKSDMSFGITVNGGAVEWGARTPNALFGQRRNLLRPAFWRMLSDIVRFNKGAVAHVAKTPKANLGEMLDALGMGDWFRHYYLLPMGGAIWSCTPEQMLKFPALAFVRFFENHGLLTITQQPEWYTVTGGSRQYVSKLAEPFKDCIRTGCGVVEVTRGEGQVRVINIRGVAEHFDHVIFGCHADQTLTILKDATDAERSVLGAFSYTKNRAFLHTDESVMPKRRACWASWIYRREGDANMPVLSVSYWMNLLQSLPTTRNVFVTLNPVEPVPMPSVLDRHDFEHPLFNREAIDAQSQIASLQGVQNSWFCGAYQRNGFHEDGLVSGMAVAQGLGAKIPWA